jgi:hypothetical protein
VGHPATSRRAMTGRPENSWPSKTFGPLSYPSGNASVNPTPLRRLNIKCKVCAGQQHDVVGLGHACAVQARRGAAITGASTDSGKGISK